VLKKKKKKTSAAIPLTPMRPSRSWEENYGDLVYDLFYSVLWNHKGAGALYLSFWNQMDKELSKNQETYSRYARSWVLRKATQLLTEGIPKHGRALTPSEQVMLDANLNIPGRLKEFESYLHKLSPDDQLLLLFRDKYGLPYEEIAPILELTEGALKLKRQQALRAMEEWLWDRT